MGFAWTAHAAAWLYPAGSLTPEQIACLELCTAACGLETTTPARPIDLADVVKLRRFLAGEPPYSDP